MAFTFQINNNVEFTHNEAFLKKAWACDVQVKTIEKQAVSMVECVKDSTKFQGIGVKKIADIEQLHTYAMKRDDTIILDFGEHCVGHFSMDIQSVGSPMDAPLYFRIRFCELPAELTMESAQYEGWLSKSWIQEEFVHLDVLPASLSLPRRYSFRYVEIKVMDTSPKWQAVFTNPMVQVESSVIGRETAQMELEDPLVQSIYDVSVKTLADCMQAVFEDGPKRDRRLWLGDLRLQALANYATYDDPALVKRCLYLFGAMPCNDGRIPANVFIQPENKPDDTFLFDYGLFFISTLYDYYQRYHDVETLHDLYPVAKAQMDASLQYVKQGKLCLQEDYPVFIDWSNEFDKDSAGQAIMIYALKQFLTLANDMKESTIDMYQEHLQRMKDYTCQNLYDQEKHLFVSGEQKEYNIASQVWMVIAQVLSKEENKVVMEQTMQCLFPIKDIATPYMYHHITEALCIAGMREAALQLMKTYWGAMITLGADTFWEAFDPDQPSYSPYGSPLMSSYCHAWSCTPAYLLQTYFKK